MNVKVPADLLQGVECLRVFANGQTQKSYLMLSKDKFTLYVTAERKRPRQQMSLTQRFFGIEPSTYSSMAGSSTTSPLSSNTTGSGSTANAAHYTEGPIDIGAIARIQRGHGTKQFVQAT
jgi:hypothetical protein